MRLEIPPPGPKCQENKLDSIGGETAGSHLLRGHAMLVGEVLARQEIIHFANETFLLVRTCFHDFLGFG
jgi:hypothetical protein